MMKKGIWIDYTSDIILEDKQRVLIRRQGYGQNFDLCVYNQYYHCFDDADGDDYFCDILDVDKIFIIPDIE